MKKLIRYYLINYIKNKLIYYLINYTIFNNGMFAANNPYEFFIHLKLRREIKISYSFWIVSALFKDSNPEIVKSKSLFEITNPLFLKL